MLLFYRIMIRANIPIIDITVDIDWIFHTFYYIMNANEALCNVHEFMSRGK